MRTVKRVSREVVIAFDDHRICSPDPWINGFIPQAPGEAFHPNPAGHARGYLPALTATTTKLDLTAA